MKPAPSPTVADRVLPLPLHLCALLTVLASQIGATAAEPAVRWAKVLGSSRHDWPEAIDIAPNGQVYLAGDINQKVLHRFETNGNLLGTQASRGEYIRGVALDAAGNHYLTGLIRDSKRLGLGLTNDFYLAKYSSTGSLLWERTGGTPTYSNIYPWNLGGFKVALSRDGTAMVAGGSTGSAVFGDVRFPATAGGPIICKYAPDGALRWLKRVEGTYNGYKDGGNATDLALNADGGIVITGWLHDGQADFGGISVAVDGTYDSDSFVATFSDAGEVRWVRLSHGGSGVATDTSGNIYSVGTSWIAGENPGFGLHCTKFSPSGDLLWERRIPGVTGERITLDGLQNPVISAALYIDAQLDDHFVPYNGYDGSGNYAPEALLCKVDATGRFQWAITASGAYAAGFGPLVADRSGNIHAAGSIRCGYEFGDYFGRTALLGSIPLEVAFPNTVNESDAFIARLFDADALVPELRITKSPSAMSLSWPVAANNHVLESTTTLPAVSWTPVTNTPTLGATEFSVELPLEGKARFFRLRQP